MKSTRFALAATAFALLAFSATAADNFSPTPVFTFIDKPGAEEIEGDVEGATTELAMKPNSSREFFLYVRNPDKAQKTFIVDLKGGPGSAVAASAKVVLPGQTWVRVRIPEAPPPAPVASAAPTTPAPAKVADAPPAEPLPPGGELTTGEGNFSFILRLLNEDGTQVYDKDKKAYGKVVTATVANPKSYIESATAKYSSVGNLVTVKVAIVPNKKFTGTSDLRLAFPADQLAPGALVREGIYKRTLEGKETTLTGAIEKAGEKIRLHVGIDGFDRAYIYESKPQADAKEVKVDDFSNKVIRLIAATHVSQPVAAFPIRIEVDNADQGDKLELQIKRAGDMSGDYETIKLGSVRDERAWLDTAGPIDGGFLLSNRSKDWIKPLDLTQLRGNIEIFGVTGGKVSEPFKLNVDATPPEDLEFKGFSAKQIKGKPIPVAITAIDKGSGIAKVNFFVGKPLDDGKLPPDAIKFDGALQPNGSWAGAIALPPEKRGEVYINAVATDNVGLSTTKTTRIELVDAPPPTGDISGIVVYGEQRQPGLTVRLMAGENEKATAKTNEWGRFKFANVPVGDYKLLVESKDASYGKAAAGEVHVVAETTAKPTLTLVKKTK